MSEPNDQLWLTLRGFKRQSYFSCVVIKGLMLGALVCLLSADRLPAQQKTVTNTGLPRVAIDIETYEQRVQLLDDLTQHALFLQIKTAGGLALWESNALAQLTKKLAGKKLHERTSSLDGLTKTWKGAPNSFTVWDTNTSHFRQVFMRPPSEEIESWILPLYERGGIAIIEAAPTRYLDVLLGLDYLVLGFRILESSPKEERVKAMGDERVYLSQLKPFADVRGFGFPTTWLGKKVWFVLRPPIRDPWSRPRLNPDTHEPEILSYGPPEIYVPARIASGKEIIEFSYEEHGVETERQVFKNLGHWEGITSNLTILKGPLLRSSVTKSLKLPEDIMQRECTRVWTDANTGEKKMETSKLR